MKYLGKVKLKIIRALPLSVRYIINRFFYLLSSTGQVFPAPYPFLVLIVSLQLNMTMFCSSSISYTSLFASSIRRLYPGLPVLCSGGVASNALLRQVMGDALFAAPQYSSDNAMGVAFLTHRALERGLLG